MNYELSQLLDISSHHVSKTGSGATVLVLNTGAVITAEDSAMLMSLHSRSPAGILSHLQKLEKNGSGGLMSSFYVGYGHKSIGDCGTTNIFIEGVSMLAAKAIQDSQLYSGQECSTRYIDFRSQPFFDPVGSETSDAILKALRAFYVDNFDTVVQHIASINPRNEGESELVYAKAVKARAFDIMRGFLPAGATTNVAWHTNLRQAADHLVKLRNHSLKEVRDIATSLQEALSEAHPNSFGYKKYQATENYMETWMSSSVYGPRHHLSDVTLAHNGIDKNMLSEFFGFLSSRPPKTELPKAVGVAGTVRFEFCLDFGSYRDLQRQRAVIQRMPLLSFDYGFEKWYLDQLPESLKLAASILLKKIEVAVKRLGASKSLTQYFVPMGYKVACQLSGDLPAMVYLVELRATKFVHPTLQVKAIKMAEQLEQEFKDFGLKIYFDLHEAGRFDVRRGQQDFVSKT